MFVCEPTWSIRFLMVIAFLSVVACPARLEAQVLEPSILALDSAHSGVPFGIPVQFTNTSDKPLRYYTSFCAGNFDGEIFWFVASDSTPFTDTTIAAGDSIDLLCLVKVVVTSPIGYGCGMVFRDADSAIVQGPQYGVSGKITKFYEMRFSPEHIDFGEVEVDSVAVDTLMIYNDWNGIAQLRIGPCFKGFMYDDYIVVNPGDSLVLPIKFAPSSVGPQTEDVQMGGYSYQLPHGYYACALSGVGVASVKGLTPLVPSVQLVCKSFDVADYDTVAYTAARPTEVIEIRLARGYPFTVEHAPLPLIVTPAKNLEISVRLLASSAGFSSYDDTLIVTTSDNRSTHVAVRGYVLATDIEDSPTTLCIAHPNPTTGEVQWCGKPLDEWIVSNVGGIVVGTIVADEAGVCRWSSGATGIYVARSRRRGESVTFVIVP